MWGRGIFKFGNGVLPNSFRGKRNDGMVTRSFLGLVSRDASAKKKLILILQEKDGGESPDLFWVSEVPVLRCPFFILAVRRSY